MAAESIIGELPNGWHYITLRNLCAASGGSIQTGPFGSQLHASDYVSDGIPCVMPQNIGDNRINEQNIARITPDDANRLRRHILRRGDIVYSRRGDVERRALVRASEDGWFCGTGCLRIRLGADVTDSDWLACYLGDVRVRAWIVRHAHGATMANLNTSILGALPVAVPPFPEQRAIAHILGSLDDKIELNRQMSATLEAMARALFESWFVRFDPVRAKAEGRDMGLPADIAALFPDSFEQSEIGEVPKGWTPQPLSHLIVSRVERQGHRVLPEFSATVRGIEPRSLRFKKTLAATFDKNKVAYRNDLVFGLSRTELNFGILQEECGAFSPVYEIFQPTPRCGYPSILAQYIRLRMDVFMDILRPAAREGQSVDRGHLLSKLIPRFPLDTQAVFESMSRPILERSASVTRSSSALVELRDTLLPKLISGELRVPDAETMLVGSGVP